jgi:hypothetical protein
MARPVCKGFCRDRRLISLLQRIRPRRSPPGQDGDTRALVLINSSASCAVFNIRLPERRLTVRPSRRHPLANLACTTGAFAPTERILRGHGYRPGVKRFPALQHRPGDPRQLVGQGDDHDIAMGPAHQPFCPTAKRRVALGHIGQSRTRSMDQLPAQVFVAALADPEQLRLAAGRELTGNQAEPRGEIAPAVEAFRPTDGTRGAASLRTWIWASPLVTSGRRWVPSRKSRPAEPGWPRSSPAAASNAGKTELLGSPSPVSVLRGSETCELERAVFGLNRGGIERSRYAAGS